MVWLFFFHFRQTTAIIIIITIQVWILFSALKSNPINQQANVLNQIEIKWMKYFHHSIMFGWWKKCVFVSTKQNNVMVYCVYFVFDHLKWWYHCMPGTIYQIYLYKAHNIGQYVIHSTYPVYYVGDVDGAAAVAITVINVLSS